MLNRITVMGRLVKDPEMRTTSTGKSVTSFRLAIDRDTKEKETDFIDCIAWQKTGEFVSKYFTKGQLAVVDGRLQIRPWTDKDGNKRYATEIIANNVYFGSSKTTSEPAPADIDAELPF